MTLRCGCFRNDSRGENGSPARPQQIGGASKTKFLPVMTDTKTGLCDSPAPVWQLHILIGGAENQLPFARAPLSTWGYATSTCLSASVALAALLMAAVVASAECHEKAIERVLPNVYQTHDLAFYCELKDKATQEHVSLEVRSIGSVGNFAGLVRAGEPIDAMSVADREQVLEQMISHAKQAETARDVNGFAVVCSRFYSLLRSTWERAIEELLFNKVVMRFEQVVKTQSLTGVVVAAESITKVFKAMTRCSALIDAHDHAIAANVAQPDSAEMKRDLEDLRTFRTEHKKKRQAQDEALKHLKG